MATGDGGEEEEEEDVCVWRTRRRKGRRETMTYSTRLRGLSSFVVRRCSFFIVDSAVARRSLPKRQHSRSDALRHDGVASRTEIGVVSVVFVLTWSRLLFAG